MGSNRVHPPVGARVAAPPCRAVVRCALPRKSKRNVMADLAYVGLIIGVFTVCALVLRGLQARSVR